MRVSLVFASLAAYCLFPVQRSLCVQFITTDFCNNLSLVLCISVYSLFLPNSHQPGWYLPKSPCYSTIFLFIASHSCPLWFLLLTCLPSPLLISLRSPPFPIFLCLLLQKQFTCQLGLLVRVSLGLMFFSGVLLEAAVISVVSRRAVMPFARCEPALIAGARYSSVNEQGWARRILPEVQFTPPDAQEPPLSCKHNCSRTMNSVQLSMMGCILQAPDNLRVSLMKLVSCCLIAVD